MTFCGVLSVVSDDEVLASGNGFVSVVDPGVGSDRRSIIAGDGGPSFCDYTG